MARAILGYFSGLVELIFFKAASAASRMEARLSPVASCVRAGTAVFARGPS